MLIHAAAGGTELLALEAGRAPGSGKDGLDESRHHVPGLLIKAESNQRHLQLRRGEDPEQASCEILARMESPSPASDADSDVAAASPDGISAFIARVLDQLALSAWLPAAFLTAGVAVLLQFRSARSANLLKAVQQLTAHPVQVLVIMIPLLVIATVVTQAFSFEAIRTLEGYWRGRGLTNLARTLMIRRHVRRKKAASKRLQRETEKAFGAAMHDMLTMGGIPFPIVKALEARVSEKELPFRLTDEQSAALDRMDWWLWCDAWHLARIAGLINKENGYPANRRILPTKLGNLLRATEDGLQHAGGDVQSFVHRRRDMVSPRVRMQHDQFRTRLDMYCTLVFVSGLLFALTPIVLTGHIGIVAVAVTFTSFAAMGMVSYLAAIASAGGYCGTLKQMDEVS